LAQPTVRSFLPSLEEIANIKDVLRQEDTEDKFGIVLIDLADLQCGCLVVPTRVWVYDSTVLYGKKRINKAFFDFCACYQAFALHFLSLFTETLFTVLESKLQWIREETI
jgi:hypothetical protein